MESRHDTLLYQAIYVPLAKRIGAPLNSIISDPSPFLAADEVWIGKRCWLQSCEARSRIIHYLTVSGEPNRAILAFLESKEKKGEEHPYQRLYESFHALFGGHMIPASRHEEETQRAAHLLWVEIADRVNQNLPHNRLGECCLLDFEQVCEAAIVGRDRIQKLVRKEFQRCL